MATVTSRGGRQEATQQQHFWLFKLTRRRFPSETKKSEASSIIGQSIEIRKKGLPKASQGEIMALENAVQQYFPDWTIDELNLEYIPSSKTKKPSTKDTERPEPELPDVKEAAKKAVDEILPENDGDSWQGTPAVEPDDNQPSNDAYKDLPSATQDKIKEIEHILKRKAAEKDDGSTSNTSRTETTPPEPEEPEDTPSMDIEIPLDKLPDDFIIPANFGHWYQLAKNNINFMLCGPAGCGKTYPAQAIAKCLDLPSYTCSLSGGVRYNQVFGSTRIQDGNTRWEPSKLLQMVQVPCVVILDEALAPDADILIGLNSLTEPNQRYIETPGGRIDVHPECRFIATANNKGRAQSRGYIGAQIQDGSILDRFGVKFDVEYDASVEMQLAKKYLNKRESERLLRKVNTLRNKLRQNEINFDPSTRRLLLCCRQIKEAGIKQDTAFETTFLTSLSLAERKTIDM